MTGFPPLCIGFPVYNGAAYLAAALESLLSQSFSDFQVVISDNCSTDGTADICQTAARQDSRIRYFRNTGNIGAGPNFNRAFSHCRSPFFKWMAHDDMLSPRALEQMMAALADNPGAVLAHSRLKLVDDTGQPMTVRSDGRVLDRHGRPFQRLETAHLAEGDRPSQRFGEALRRMNWCTAVFGIIRSDALVQTHLHGSYYEADRVLLAELALLGRFVQLDEAVMIKRYHAGVSVLKPYREQCRMIDPAVIPMPKGVRLRLGYARTLSVGRIGPLERAACALVVLRVALRNRISLRLITWLRRQSEPPAPPAPTGHSDATL